MKKIKAIAILFFLICQLLLFAEENYTYNLSVAAIFQDEAPYFKEWIEYHKMLGVEHFYLFNNQSADNYKEVLDPYIKSDDVTLIDWPNRKITKKDGKHAAWVLNTQAPAYYHALELAKGTSKWLAIIDLDEFIVPVADENINAFLEKHNDASQILILWQAYGTSNIVDIPENKLLIESLTWKSGPNFWMHTIPKAIVRPENVLDFSWIPHKLNCRNGSVEYNTTIDEIRINHYVTRTLSYFYNYKLKKKAAMEGGKVSPGWINSYLKMGHDIEDRIMDKFVPELKQRMGLK